MAKFSRGLAAEGRLISKLKEFGCQIMTADASMDHEKKLDFVILGLPEFPRLLEKPLGVQLTLTVGQLEKREEFFRRTQRNPYAPKNLYLELEEQVNLEEGGAYAVLVAITQFLIDKRFAAWKIGSVRISANLTYEFRTQNGAIVVQAPPATPMDIAETSEPSVLAAEPMPAETGKLPEAPSPVSPPPAPPEVPPLAFSVAVPETPPEALQPTSVPEGPPNVIVSPPQERPRMPARPASPGALRFPAATRPGSFGVALSKAMGVTLLSGQITRFNAEQGMGTIVAAGAGQKEYFLHWKNIGDPQLLATLNDLPRAQQRLLDPIRVQFADGGIIDGKKNRKALDIKRLAQ